MTFKEYTTALQEFLELHPEAADKPVFIGNGYCTSEEYVQVNRTPFLRPLLGKQAKRIPGDVVMLI